MSNPFEPGIDSPVGHDSGSRDPVPMEIGAIVGRAWEIFTDNVGLVLGAILIPVAV